MADHLLHLMEVDGNSVRWDFTCQHDTLDERWWPVHADGTPILDIDGERSSLCWLWSHWDAFGDGLIGCIDFDGQPVSFPLPVKPMMYGGLGEPFTLVRDDNKALVYTRPTCNEWTYPIFSKTDHHLCDMCSGEKFEHDYEWLPAVTPFGGSYQPWSTEQIDEWHENGLIDDERHKHLTHLATLVVEEARRELGQ